MKKITLFCFLCFAVNSYSQTQLLSEVQQVDIGGGNWINSSGINYEYENNNLKSETDFFWTGTAWEKSDKITYTYNANNKASEEIYQSYNSSTGMFENEDKSVYTYKANGDLIKIEGYIWESNDWSIESIADLTYDGSNVTGGISQDYDGAIWTNTFKTTLSYNNGKISQIIEEEWDTDIDDWVLDGRDTFTYNGNNISSVKYDNRNGAVWEEAFTTTFIVDGNGNRTSETDTFVNGGGTDTTTYTYDMSALMSSFDNPFADYNDLEYLYEDFPYFNKILSETSTNNFRTVYDYNNVLSINDELNKKSITLEVYPNPSTEYVTVKSSESVDYINIFSALGNKILTTKQKKISVSHLSKGIYLMNISLDDGRKITKKLIKN